MKIFCLINKSLLKILNKNWNVNNYLECYNLAFSFSENRSWLIKFILLTNFI
jgi:hypothetical protein